MISKVLGVIREMGVDDGLLYLIHRALSRISSSCAIINYDLVVQPVAETPIISPRVCRKIEIREIFKGDTILDVSPVPISTMNSRFDQGTRCFGAFRGEILLGYGFLGFSTYEEDEVRIDYHLPADAAFDFDIYVLPDYRLGRTFACLWEGLNSILRERRLKGTYSRISRFNVQSRRSHGQLGAQVVGRLIALRLWSFQLVYTSISPYIRVLARKSRRAELRLPELSGE